MTNVTESGDKIMANHVISSTGGKGFTEAQIKVLTGLAGSKDDGTPYTIDELSWKRSIKLRHQARPETTHCLFRHPRGQRLPLRYI